MSTNFGIDSNCAPLPSRRSVSIVIPACNEGKRIEGTIVAMARHLEELGYDYEVIVVDDGSRDDTFFKLERLQNEQKHLHLIRNKQNRGKGFAVRQGVLAASMTYIFYTDADLSVPIEMIEQFCRLLDDGSHLVIGSRAVPGAMVIGRPFHRRVMAGLLNRFIQAFLFRGIRDTQCGFKAFRRDVAHTLFRAQRLDGFSFDIEILYLAQRLGYRIREALVRYTHRRASTVRPLIHGVQVFFDLLKLRAGQPS